MKLWILVLFMLYNYCIDFYVCNVYYRVLSWNLFAIFFDSFLFYKICYMIKIFIFYVKFSLVI